MHQIRHETVELIQLAGTVLFHRPAILKAKILNNFKDKLSAAIFIKQYSITVMVTRQMQVF